MYSILYFVIREHGKWTKKQYVEKSSKRALSIDSSRCVSENFSHIFFTQYMKKIFYYFFLFAGLPSTSLPKKKKESAIKPNFSLELVIRIRRNQIISNRLNQKSRWKTYKKNIFAIIIFSPVQLYFEIFYFRAQLSESCFRSKSVSDDRSNSSLSNWVCPNDRQLMLRAK